MMDLIFFSASLLGMIFLSYLANLAFIQQSVSPLYRFSYTIITMALFVVVMLFGWLTLFQENFTMGTGFIVPSIAALCCFSYTVRRWLARFLPIDPYHPVHTLTLALAMVIIIDLWVTLAKGLKSVNQQTPASPTFEAMMTVWTQDVLLLLLALIGVGWLTRRTLRQSLQRLGVKPITWKELGIALLIALGLALFSIGIQHLSAHTGLGSDPNADALTEKQLGALSQHLLGWLSLGFGAAIGEEALFRGALQPRLGLWLTTILFTLSHTNYGLSIGTFVVFTGGLVLGWTQMRYHLIVTLIAHAMYNLFITLFNFLL
jgi:membrane protease YdiL (CAAX protease family)